MSLRNAATVWIKAALFGGLRKGEGEDGGREEHGQERVTGPLFWLGPASLWAGSTYALWTPTSSVVPLMPFLTLRNNFPFSEPQFLCLENGTHLPTSMDGFEAPAKYVTWLTVSARCIDE